MTSSNISEIVFDPRQKISLRYTEGDVIPYNDYPLPAALSKPLRKSSAVKHVSGLSSGMRSALLNFDSDWFKYKGIIPISKEYYQRGEPIGGMREATAKRELKLNEKINDKYEEFGCNPPSKPAASVESNLYFNGERIFGIINKIEGDTRLNYLLSRAENKTDTKRLRDFSEGVYSWMGFSDRVLKESDIKLSETDDDLTNTVLYRVGDGFGLGKVDHEMSLVDKRNGWKNPCLLSQLNVLPFTVIIKETASDLNEELDELEFLSVDINPIKSEKEWIQNKEMNKLIHMNEKRFRLIGEMEKIYYKNYDGKCTPEPINKELIKWAIS